MSASTLTKPEPSAQLALDLTEQEVNTLRFCEAQIEVGLTTFYQVGSAFAKIRDQRLYRADYSTFEEYCEKKWGMSKSHAYRMMEAAQIVENISPIGDDLPANESQVRPLAALEPEQQKEAWKEAVVESRETGQPITAAKVQEKVDAIKLQTPKPTVPLIPALKSTEPEPPVTVTDKRGTAKPQSPPAPVPKPAAAAKPEEPLKPPQMMTCLIPVDEYDWLCEQSWTPAVALAKLRELSAAPVDQEWAEDVFTLRLDGDMANKLRRVCEVAGEEPRAYLIGLIEKRFSALEGANKQ